MRRWMVGSLVVLVGACSKGPGHANVSPGTGNGSGGSGSTVTLTLGEKAVASSVCSLVDQCADQVGRAFVNASACTSYVEGQYLEDLLNGGQHPSAGDATNCATSVGQLGCSAITQSTPGSADSACARFFSALGGDTGSTQTQTSVALGGDCSGDGVACTGSTSCTPDSTGGAACFRCTALAGSGDNCAAVDCADGLMCDYSQTTPTCVAVQGKTCTTDDDCSYTTVSSCSSSGDCSYTVPYFCDISSGATSGTCQPRVAGSPCTVGDFCGASGDLTCINSQCAAFAAVGQACDSDDDCQDPDNNFCQSGACAARLSRGTACDPSTDECRGFLVCRTTSTNSGATCTDLPGTGEACTDQCLLPLVCENNTCQQVSGTGSGLLANGDVCATDCSSSSSGSGSSGSSGSSCTQSTGVCTDGYCDTSTGAAIFYCTPYLALGASCSYDEQCSATVAYCSQTATAPTCTAYAALGASCAISMCNPSSAYCDANQKCAALQASGTACTDPSQCIDGACYGTCNGGTDDGKPCSSQWDCLNGTCNGTCSVSNPTWQGCAG